MRIFGARKARLSISSDELILESISSERFIVRHDNLTHNNIFTRKLLFFELALPTDRGMRRFRGLPKAEIEGLFRWLADYLRWLREYQKFAPMLSQCADEINTLLHTDYLRHSRWLKLKAKAAAILLQFHKVPPLDCLKHDCGADFALVQQIASSTKQDVEGHRDRYVRRFKAKFSKYFDCVGNKPLTEKQRDACVIDEDNNLVLASAGTGKTSTMIGRAGFLLKSKKAKPKQILMLAFAKKAAEEMQERLSEQLNEKGVIASTFHKLGRDIITSVEEAQPSLSPWAEDVLALQKQVDAWFEELLRHSQYVRLVTDYFLYYKYRESSIDQFNFQTEGDYWKYLSVNELRTLQGEKVKGFGECLIANHLLRLGIKYQYEADYKDPTRTLKHRQYQPDFYLVEYGIYLEHWGIDRGGNTAPFIPREKYHESMEWKRRLHAQKGTRLIETYHYENVEGSLLRDLEKKLMEAGVKFQKRSSEEMLQMLREFGTIKNFTPLLARLLQRYKNNLLCSNNEKGPEKIGRDARLNQSVKQALKIVEPIYEKYEAFLKENRRIDFDDMLGKAIRYVQEGRFTSPWQYILVDEFQDISELRARLIKALRESVPECSLFCVGDDWQSIYRFTGSDLHFTTEFEAKFGITKITILDKTFRFDDSICNIASRFIQANPKQIKKPLLTHTFTKDSSVSLLRANNKNSSMTNTSNYDSRLDTILEHISSRAVGGSSVYVLGRYNFTLPRHEQIITLGERFPRLRIAASTIHSAKGLEADYVVILDLEQRGKYTFPIQKNPNPLLEALLPVLDDFPYAEERRLFYVALTRARKRVYLISDMTKPSEFVTELLDNKYPLALDDFAISLKQKFAALIPCIKCKTGTLVVRQYRSKIFYGCSNEPLCKHVESGCTRCNNPMRRINRFKVCIDPNCSVWTPLCSECGADMIQRNGVYGKFWACKNYRGNYGNSCKHTEKEISYNLEKEESFLRFKQI